MLRARLGPWMVVMGSVVMGSVLSACSVGGEGPTTTTAFDPNNSGTETGPASSTGTGPETADGMTSTPPPDTGDPPSDASCCQVAPTPGCGNQETETCVCTLEPQCCQSVWSQDCVDMAIDPCADPMCGAMGSTGMPGDSSSGDGAPTQSCDEVAAQEGWMYYRCQSGDLQCNAMGTPTTDCDYCCGYCNDAGDVSCGDLAENSGWANANCEWNGNGACGGSGTPTCDCNFCCEVN
jgi:hypothetical protein